MFSLRRVRSYLLDKLVRQIGLQFVRQLITSVTQLLAQLA